MVNDPHLAKDVSQGVFVALAKDAGKLTDHPVLSGWLHRTARNIAAQAVRTEVRRRKRELQSAVMNENSETDASWQEIAPHLDAALADLSEPDRDAVLLRYFQNKPAQEMATILGISAEAAQKRVSRAVERLRENFAKRGITAGAGGHAGSISAHAVQAAPVGLASAISSTVCAGTASLIVTKLIAMSVIQKTIVAATLAALLDGITRYKIQKPASVTVTVTASAPATATAWPTKSRAKTQPPATAQVSAHNKARIRATLKSATKAANKVIADWVSLEPVAASTYLRDLPPSASRDSLLIHLVEELARTEDFPMATDRANSLQGGAKEKALALVKLHQDILRRLMGAANRSSPLLGERPPEGGQTNIYLAATRS